MNSTCGDNLKLTIFGASHDPEIGMTLEGVPANETIDADELQRFLSRRAPGRNAYSTSRQEADIPEFRSGLADGVTDGKPITAVIRNTNAHSKDYDELKYIPRPGHADYTAAVKYFGTLNMAGGGPFSGRMTAPLCIAGGIAKQLLEKQGITITARIKSIAGIEDGGNFEDYLESRSKTAETDTMAAAEYLETLLSRKDFPVLDDKQGEKMKEAILNAKAEGDSVGGIVECAIFGLPTGLGGPLFDGMEGRIAKWVFGIPAVKGVEFGEGFRAAALKGSENNDPFTVSNGTVRTKTNHAGGILGGITDGMPLVFRAAFKPTPSIGKVQQSVDLRTLEETVLEVQGRHDPCIVPRAVPVVEAAAALAVYDALLEREKEIQDSAAHAGRRGQDRS
ncbi:MAG: chorismate synthase [Lachnospiraceae bacterium]|nr:chorismate synthase [Lachnospiraceae bacterium]